MFEVWGRATSSNVQAVMWTLGELGLDDRVTRHDRGHAFGGLDTPEYLAMNPHGRVPTFRDGDGPALWESAAVVRYLAARYGDAAFWPADPAARAPLDMWAEWIKTGFGPAFAQGVFWPFLRGGVPTAEAVEACAAGARLLDARLGEGPWLDGETFRWADVLTGHLLYRWYTLDWARPDLPALSAYYDRLKARPAFARHVMVDYAVLATPA
ncbi:MAG: glutathione S-transferase family protein [Pseudomonadota bacterium]